MVIYTADSSQVKEDQTMTVGGGRTQNVIIYLGSNIRGQILNNIQVQRSNIQGQIVNNKLMSIASSEQHTQVQIFIYRTKKNNSMMRKLFALEYINDNNTYVFYIIKHLHYSRQCELYIGLSSS